MKRVKIFQGEVRTVEKDINEFLDEGNIIESITQTNHDKYVLFITIIYNAPNQIASPPKFDKESE